MSAIIIKFSISRGTTFFHFWDTLFRHLFIDRILIFVGLIELNFCLENKINTEYK